MNGALRLPLSAPVAVAIAAIAAIAPRVAGADPMFARDGPFDSDAVVRLARALAQAPFAPPKSPLPKALADLSYDQYRDIRPRPSSTIWANGSVPFHVQMLPRGFLFADPVEIALVARGQSRHVAYSPDLFTTGTVMTRPLPTQDIGFSGFRVQYPLNHPALFDEVAVFQGASYFRSLAPNQGFGLSARGLAIKTAEPEGEEFPAFRAFWIEEPPRASPFVVIHALLDSPSVAGAYRFSIHPGTSASPSTVIDVEAVLFARTTLDKVGLAPGTSMFMFSPNGRVSADDYRPEVHDSDGLLILNGGGEHIWRPLANPSELQVSGFVDRDPRGFGLLQRDRTLADYQDLEAHYEKRPSLWIEPAGPWGEGSVVLTEIPSNAETHDNIVAFWRPRVPLAGGREYRFAYGLSWGDGPKAALDRARVVATRRGRADVRAPSPLRRFVIDYTQAPGVPASRLKLPKAAVSASAGEIRDVVVAENPILGGYRVSFVLDPKQAKLAELRVDLDFKDTRHAETWVYRWTDP